MSSDESDLAEHYISTVDEKFNIAPKINNFYKNADSQTQAYPVKY